MWPGDISSGHAQGWRVSASWTEIALLRIAASPVSGRRRRLGLGEDEVEDAVEDVVLVGDVVVQRHRLEAERLAELAHRQRLDPALVGELERRLQDPVAAEGETRFGCGGH